MRTLLFFVATLLLSFAAAAQNPRYDSIMAKQLGADDYGMKQYILVILKTGTNTTTDRAFIDSCFSGHMENISRMVSDGHLVVAGPLMRNENNYRGIFILNLTDLEEAKELLQNDPAIKEQLLQADLFLWYGSAALPLYLDETDKIWKKKI